MFTAILRHNTGHDEGLSLDSYYYEPKPSSIYLHNKDGGRRFFLNDLKHILIYHISGELVWCKAWVEVKVKPSDG